MEKIRLLSNGISLKERKIDLGIAEFVATGQTHRIEKYNEVEINVGFYENYSCKDEVMNFIAETIAKKFKGNKGKNVEIKSCWTSSNKVYNGLLREEYYGGWIRITYEKEIKNLNTVAKNLDILVNRILNDKQITKIMAGEV